MAFQSLCGTPLTGPVPGGFGFGGVVVWTLFVSSAVEQPRIFHICSQRQNGWWWCQKTYRNDKLLPIRRAKSARIDRSNDHLNLVRSLLHKVKLA